MRRAPSVIGSTGRAKTVQQTLKQPRMSSETATAIDLCAPGGGDQEDILPRGAATVPAGSCHGPLCKAQRARRWTRWRLLWTKGSGFRPARRRLSRRYSRIPQLRRLLVAISWWTGSGAPGFAVSLPEDRRIALRELIRRTLRTAPDGSIQLTAHASGVRGTKPEGPT